ncbi:MAG: hypothetical protein RLZZ153_677 [Pseudomonadota bacterium]
MKLIFAGTPEFAASVLQALAQAGHDIALVLCQPDRPAGRGQTLQAPAVKRCAQALGLPVYQPDSLRTSQAREIIAATQADLMLVVAYGLIIPADVLSMPRRGCMNVHASLLPRWRGAAPIQRAIEAGDRQTGITIMQMDAGLDTGPMLLWESIDIGERETGGQLHDRLAVLGGQLAVRALAALARGALLAQPQPDQGVTYAHKIKADDTVLDWRLDARTLMNRIRAFDPSPGAQARLVQAPDERLKIWAARVLEVPAEAAPGTVVEAGAHGLVVACGNGRLAVDSLQRAGGRRMAAGAFLAGYPIKPGDRFVIAA